MRQAAKNGDLDHVKALQAQGQGRAPPRFEGRIVRVTHLPRTCDTAPRTCDILAVGQDLQALRPRPRRWGSAYV